MGISIWQILIVLLIVMILFGAGKLPRMMGDLAKGVKSFKKGLKDDDDEGQEEPANPRVIEAREEKSAPHATATSADEKDKVAKG